MGFPDGSDSKESSCNVGNLGLIPGLGRSPGGGHDSPLQYAYLENPHGQRNLAGYSPWGKQRVRHDWVNKYRTAQRQKNKCFFADCRHFNVYSHILSYCYRDRTQERRKDETFWEITISVQFSSVQFSHSVVSESLRHPGSQHTRPLWPSPASGVFKLMSIESVMPSNHLILCHPLLLSPSIFPSISVFSNESALCIR